MFTEEVILNHVSKNEVDEVIETAKSECEKIKIKNPQKKNEVLMGIIMKKLRGRVSAKAVADKIGFVKGVN